MLDPETAARKTDPASSRIAGMTMTRAGWRASQMQQVIRLVRLRPGLTARELAHLAPPGSDYEMIFHRLCRRLADGRRIGALRNGDMRICSASRRICQTWYCNY